ncbi:hypothetical protein CC79DRAFT_181678 [Sarocladium strictum]
MATNTISSDDDLIILPDSPPIDRRSINFLLNDPENTDQPRSERSRHDRPQRRNQPPRPVATSAFIDLTEEPDSPEEQRPAAGPSVTGSSAPWPEERPTRSRRPEAWRNPRRTNPTRISPPGLTRSDSTLREGHSRSIIDLTGDSPEESRPSLQLPRMTRLGNGPPPHLGPHPSLPRHHHRHHQNHPHRHQRQPTTDEIVEVVTAVGTVGDFVQNSLRHYHGFITGGFSGLARAWNPPSLDVTTNAFAPRPETPQPPLDPVPPPRAGFTRNTHAESEPQDEEEIAVCPACLDELAYDPTETTKSASANTTATGKKRKRAPGEHHFWALKKCGHVYCADCFENRKPTKANPGGVGFQLPNNKTGAAAFAEMRCAVDSCETKVAQKGEWVGIFL